MRQTLLTRNQGQDLVIIQGAYSTYCASGDLAETLYDHRPFASLTQATRAIDIVSQPAWLRFQTFVQAWRHERGATSSVTMAAMCPAYQSIIGMGEVAVRLIIKQLQAEGDEPDQWFWALKAITGIDPVPDRDRGDFPAMARAWIGWAESQAIFAW